MAASFFSNDQNLDTVNTVFGNYDPYFLVDTGSGITRPRILSDAHGTATFTLIRDYSLGRQDFQLRHQESSLIMAERDIPTGGELNGARYVTRYRTGLSGSYSLCSQNYRSYAIGLAVDLLVVAFGGPGIYRYPVQTYNTLS